MREREGERERGRERERETERETETEREREKETQRERDAERVRARERESERESRGSVGTLGGVQAGDEARRDELEPLDRVLRGRCPPEEVRAEAKLPDAAAAAAAAAGLNRRSSPVCGGSWRQDGRF